MTCQRKVSLRIWRKMYKMCRSLFLIAARLFLLYCFAMWHFIIYFTLMHVITGVSTSWSVMDKCDILRYVSKAFVDIFMLKTICYLQRRNPTNYFRVGKMFGFPQAFEVLYVWKPKCLKIMLEIVLIWKITSPLFYWPSLTHSSTPWPPS